MQSIYVDINCKGLFQNGINFGSSALFNLKSDEVGDTGDWICDCGERNKRKFCADLSFRHWRVENEKSDFYKWNHGRRFFYYPVFSLLKHGFNTIKEGCRR